MKAISYSILTAQLIRQEGLRRRFTSDYAFLKPIELQSSRPAAKPRQLSHRGIEFIRDTQKRIHASAPHRDEDRSSDPEASPGWKICDSSDRCATRTAPRADFSEFSIGQLDRG